MNKLQGFYAGLSDGHQPSRPAPSAGEAMRWPVRFLLRSVRVKRWGASIHKGRQEKCQYMHYHIGPLAASQLHGIKVTNVWTVSRTKN